MRYIRIFRSFRQEEDGAVTVDWVVLTAAVVGLGFAALAAIRTATGDLTTKITNHMSTLEIQSTF